MFVDLQDQCHGMLSLRAGGLCCFPEKSVAPQPKTETDEGEELGKPMVRDPSPAPGRSTEGNRTWPAERLILLSTLVNCDHWSG